MKKRTLCADVRAAMLATVAIWGCTAFPSTGWGGDLHLCQLVSGEAVAEAVHGRMTETRAAEGRCIYFVTMPEGRGSAAFVIYQHPAADYEELRAVQEGEIIKVDGLGDEAVLTVDKEAKRYWLLATLRDKVTLQISGDDADQVRQVGSAALEQFAGK